MRPEGAGLGAFLQPQKWGSQWNFLEEQLSPAGGAVRVWSVLWSHPPRQLRGRTLCCLTLSLSTGSPCIRQEEGIWARLASDFGKCFESHVGLWSSMK